MSDEPEFKDMGEFFNAFFGPKRSRNSNEPKREPYKPPKKEPVKPWYTGMDKREIIYRVSFINEEMEDGIHECFFQSRDDAEKHLSALGYTANGGFWRTKNKWPYFGDLWYKSKFPGMVFEAVLTNIDVY